MPCILVPVKLAAVAGVAALLLVVAGCSDQSEPAAVVGASPSSAPALVAANPVPKTAAPSPVVKRQPTLAELRAKGVSAVCNDGTYSYSQHRSGTCSHHGGVRTWTGRI